MRSLFIPLFAGKPSHPFVPLGPRPAGARSGGQGRPKAGAWREPFTAASTLAGWRQSGVGSAILTAAVLLSCGAAPGTVWAQDAPVAAPAAAHPYAGHVADAARRFGIPEAWIWAVMRVESRGNSRAVSRAGAMGLMQIMPATWGTLRARYGLGPDPFDVRDNIMAGAAYLREMHDRYGNASAMLAAYNAGPGRYDDYVSRGRPLPAETVGYLAQLTAVVGAPGAVETAMSPPQDRFAWRRSTLFVRITGSGSASSAAQSDDTSDAPGSVAARATEAQEIAVPSSPETQADTLFVPRAHAGRPQ